MGKQHYIRRLTLQDAHEAVLVSQSVNWNHQVRDWQRVLQWSGNTAYGVIKLNRLIATACAIRFGRQRAWLCMIVTQKRFQGQGFGTQVTQTALESLQRSGVQEIMLDATEIGQNTYERLGFRPLWKMDIWVGQPNFSDVVMPETLRPITKEDLPQVSALDATVFGADRSRILQDLLAEFPDFAWVDVVDDEVQGFIMAQKSSGERAHVGPWIHKEVDGAQSLLARAAAALPSKVLRIETPEHNWAAREIVAGAGFTQSHICTRMVHGDSTPETNNSLYFGIAGFTVG